MPARPVVDARHLGARDQNRWAYRNVDLAVPPGTVVALVGPGDGGRSALTRTLAGHLMPSEGTLRVCGHPIPDEVAAAQARLTVATLPEIVTTDLSTRVHQCVEAQLLLSDLPADSDMFDAAADVVGFAAEREAPVGDLSRLDRRLLAVSLALMLPSELILLNDADAGMDEAEQQTLWRALAAVARTGTAVIAGATTPPSPADQILALTSGIPRFVS